MDAWVPLVMALDDPGAAPGVVGGKGASLARLARAGFRVPPGFHVTTSAYLDFIGRGGLREPALAAMSAVDVSDAATFYAAAARIGDLFAAPPPPPPPSSPPPTVLGHSGDLPACPLPGSTTLPQLRGEAAVLHAVKRCSASLLSSRAIGYRARCGVEPGEVSIAVVVQRLVLAEAAGVMFTSTRSTALAKSRRQRELGPRRVRRRGRGHPRRRGRRPGVGDARQLPGGQQGDDDRGLRYGHPVDRHADRPAFSGGALAGPGGELARVGLAIEKLYGEPMDIEWALAAGELSVVQARPITTPASRPAAGPGEQWNDSLDGDYLWSNGNLARPSLMP